MFNTHHGRVAVVTGASRGIGQAIATMMTERGVTVVGVDINEMSETMGRVEQVGGHCVAITRDLSRRNEIHRLVGQVEEAFGRGDILVNNAAYLS